MLTFSQTYRRAKKLTLNDVNNRAEQKDVTVCMILFLLFINYSQLTHVNIDIFSDTYMNK